MKATKSPAPATDVDNQRTLEANRQNLPFNSLGLASTILTSGLGTTTKASTAASKLGGGGIAVPN